LSLENGAEQQENRFRAWFIGSPRFFTRILFISPDSQALYNNAKHEIVLAHVYNVNVMI
jgi:hypothetical protein